MKGIRKRVVIGYQTVRTLMLYICCHWSLDYDQSGVGYLIPLYLNRATHYRLVAGGSHRISNALLKAIFENQGQIRTNAQIKRIIVEKGTAKGVEMEDGTQFMTDKAVVSTLDTHQTFLKYVGASFQNDFRRALREDQLLSFEVEWTVLMRFLSEVKGISRIRG
jgi:phytoene dehydrogenase-like protein